MKEQITIEELLALEPGSYLLYDMRDRYSFDYGAIPGAEHKEQAAILERRTACRKICRSSSAAKAVSLVMRWQRSCAPMGCRP